MQNAYEGRRQAPPLPTTSESASPLVGAGESRETGVRETTKAAHTNLHIAASDLHQMAKILHGK